MGDSRTHAGMQTDGISDSWLVRHLPRVKTNHVPLTSPLQTCPFSNCICPGEMWRCFTLTSCLFSISKWFALVSKVDNLLLLLPAFLINLSSYPPIYAQFPSPEPAIRPCWSIGSSLSNLKLLFLKKISSVSAESVRSGNRRTTGVSEGSVN